VSLLPLGTLAFLLRHDVERATNPIEDDPVPSSLFTTLTNGRRQPVPRTCTGGLLRVAGRFRLGD
jgi:hypothetical protein